MKGVKRQKHLYDFRGNAFLRRDGSLQGPLKARQVQEWTRMVRVIVSFCSDQDGDGDIFFCRDKHNFVVTKVLLQQAYFSCDKRRVLL